ncbi:MAG TPA: S16 family serine protease, partial [Micavibrio sp.]
FIMTTNDVHALPSALVDRMEIIALDAYSNEEKIAIAEKYLVPKHLKQCGLDLDQLKIERSAIELLIADYTQEPGVRKLEEHIKSICRKTNTAMQKKMTKQAVITAENVKYLLGPARVYKTLVPQQDMVGAMTGLYYSDIGGGAMPIQVKSRLQEKAQLTITGLPGQMIKESVQNALEMIKHNAARYGIDAQKLDKTHIHMHLPDGASPKDGPSAGIASATAMISSLTGIKTRHDVAMTGEVDLYGNVLPIGGLKQKLQGARKVGAKTVLIPAQNEPDLYDVPDHLQRDLRIIPVTHMDEVLQHAMSAWDFNLQASFQQAANVPDPARVPAANTPITNTPVTATPEPPAAQDVENAVRLMAAHPEIMAQALLRISGNKGPR